MNGNNQNIGVSRRKLLQFGSGVIGTGLLTTVLGSNLINSEPVIAQNNITPDEAIAKLMEGNQRFVQGKQIHPHQSAARLAEIAKAQTPFAAILSCADSRVPSEIVFDQGFGDLFIVRNAGDVATPEEIGSIEFGTLILGAQAIMVLGHEDCGAVKATLKGGELPGQIGAIVAQIQPAVTNFQGQENNKEAVKKAVEANVLYQIERLKESSVISELLQSKKLKIIGGYYDLNTGKVTRIG